VTVRIFAVVPAMVLALGAATALAEPVANPFAHYDQASAMDHSPPLRPYDQASKKAAGTAYVSDGSDPSYLREQRLLRHEPGYSVGMG
jgi:hypothetical protein